MAASQTRSSIRRRQLARELRTLRDLAGMTGEDVAKALGWSSAKVSRIENAAISVKTADLRKLLALYQVPENQRDRLIELARTADQRGWWDAVPTVPADLNAYLALENEAHKLLSYSALVLHGLLQTEDYARSILSDQLAMAPGAIRRQVDVRMRRQQRLTGPEPLQFRGVIDEAAVLRQVGGPEVMRDQLRHLLELAERPNIRLQILPFGAGGHPAVSGPFIILEIPDPGADVVYVELMNRNIYIEDDVDVHRHVLAFDILRNKALPVEETPAFIQRRLTELE
ncbi:helix-turn-helix domain-containing protein [Thermomonospora cellulosilytica]|uniref:Transcriptional regulator with XRE-family HTH domain n=1 Tax=Thermomonospora cellulosilytica TaxID=1411118 RepID=A0A7W3N5E8_9ACTN|nr:helix-turn-helix transcriptional regulator [Thermomonospora cellulosilytica]MBA9007792.1 transcriptional regulator with XRE-family HTH domain [Thermomonospora cellulosilytica]